MKCFCLIFIVQVCFACFLFGQSEIKNDNDCFKLVISDAPFRLFTADSINILTEDPVLALPDRIAFKKLCDSIDARHGGIFSINGMYNNLIFVNIDNFKFKPLPKQKFFLSIHDYSAGWNLSRVSRYENPFFDNPKDLRFLWSGHIKPYKEIGFPKFFFHSDQQSSILIYFIRGKKGIKGFRIERLEPEVRVGPEHIF